MRKIVKILDVNIDVLSMNEAVNKVFEFVQEDRNHVICTPNAEIIYAAKNDLELKEILNHSDMNTADGAGVILGAKILNLPLTEKVSGFDLVRNIILSEKAKGLKLFLFGCAPGVAELAGEKIKEMNHGVEIVGYRNGFFTEKDDSEIVTTVSNANCDIILVALGVPKQEKWIYKHRNELNTKVCIGVGGSLDVFAGKLKLSPDFFRRNGLEWLYRLAKQPSRIVRMLSLPKFVILLIKERIFTS
jgi:N-acetylglucosaminyldiphosphoundecaprenol N-acetyl-beta-D-mannosaminyltransferase